MAMQAIRAASKETVPGIPSRLPALAGETFGTFVLTLSGTATLLATARIGHSTAASVGSQIAVSVAFGFGILAAVYAVATVSGAHINPAVTFGLAAAREFPWRLIPAYWAAQLLGGILAALVNWGMYGDKLGSALDLSTTRPGPGVPVIVALLAEFVLTAVLPIVVMSTAVYRRGDARGLAIGLWIGCAVFLAFPVSGGSLNPARTLGPGIVSAAFPAAWIYTSARWRRRVRQMDLAVPQAGRQPGQGEPQASRQDQAAGARPRGAARARS